ncbi:hypothetical protein HK102_011586, partial [Quaeritorhiza haematococci]
KHLKELEKELEDWGRETGITEDWDKVGEVVKKVVRRQLRSARLTGSVDEGDGLGAAGLPGVGRGSSNAATVPTTSTAAPKTSTPEVDALARRLEELSLKYAQLERAGVVQPQAIMSGTSGGNLGAGGYKGARPLRCLWCDATDHRRQECPEFIKLVGQGDIVLVNRKAVLKGETEPIPLNPGRGGSRALVLGRLPRANANAMHYSVKGDSANSVAETYSVEIAELFSVELEPQPVRVAQSAQVQAAPVAEMRRAAERLRRKTGWECPIDAVSVGRYAEKPGKDRNVAYVDEKRKSEPGEGPTSAAQGKRTRIESEPIVEIPQRRPTLRTTGSDPNIAKTAQKVRGEKGVEKERPKVQQPAYRFMSDVEKAVDLREVLEERILGAEVKLTLRELLGITRQDLRDVVIQAIRRKKQLTGEAIAAMLDAEFEVEEDLREEIEEEIEGHKPEPEPEVEERKAG